MTRRRALLLVGHGVVLGILVEHSYGDAVPLYGAAVLGALAIGVRRLVLDLRDLRRWLERRHTSRCL